MRFLLLLLSRDGQSVFDILKAIGIANNRKVYVLAICQGLIKGASAVFGINRCLRNAARFLLILLIKIEQTEMSIRLGLERIIKLLDLLDNPQKGFKVVQVSGTNGKGSVCAYVASVLCQVQDLVVGQFNSPHLIEPRDAIRVNKLPISSDSYKKYSQLVDQVASQNMSNDPPTPFECETALCFLAFADLKVDIAVIECGMGGRYDATNVFESNLLSIVTSIGVDHLSYLGGSIDGIIWHKVGIAKANSRMVLSIQNDIEIKEKLRQIASQECHKIKCKLITDLDPCQIDSEGNFIHQSGLTFKPSLIGDYQRINTSCAITALLNLKTVCQGMSGVIRKISLLTDQQIVKGLEQTKWPGRIQFLKIFNKEVILDGAHNLQACLELKKFVIQKFSNREISWIIGFSKGKDCRELIQALTSKNDQVLFTQFTQPDNMPWVACENVHDLQKIADSLQLNSSFSLDVTDAFNSCKNELIIVCGSLYLVADFIRKFKIELQW